jgi:hypothetical protein
MIIGLDIYALSPELNHLRQTGVATVWQVETDHARRVENSLVLVQADEYGHFSTLNKQHLSAISGYGLLTENWDEDDAPAPTALVVSAALRLAVALSVSGQPIYHTSPGPVGEIMINLRNADKSVELLMYPNGRNKFVRISPNVMPQQGLLTPETLRETVQWLNR